MRVDRLWLTDFRCYEAATLRFPPGVTVICGANAQGNTSLLEAVGWAATGKSFEDEVPEEDEDLCPALPQSSDTS